MTDYDPDDDYDDVLEVDGYIVEPNPDLVTIMFDEKRAYALLAHARDRARALKAKRAAEAAAAQAAAETATTTR